MKNWFDEINNLLAAGKTNDAAALLQDWKNSEDYIFNEDAAILESSILLAQNELLGAEGAVRQGLTHDPYNGELYFVLGQIKEAAGNIKQAQASYENALYYCHDEDFEALSQCYKEFCRINGRTKVSIILVTYNQLDMTKFCVDSIRRNIPYGTYEIIIVDNNSTDGTQDWLRGQDDVKYLLNGDNKGFPAACNQGAKMAGKGNDIFLLNNDTIVMKNSIYTLRMALYEEDRIGAVGSCSNYVSKNQQIAEHFNQLEDYEEYAKTHNIYTPSCHEKRLSLVGFALMVRRDAWEEVDGLDEIYGLGNFEDDDISLKLLVNDYKILFCPDSFIFHFGSQSFGKSKEKYNSLLLRNRELFNSKWGVSWAYFIHIRKELIEYLPYQKQDSFSILDIGCGSGATLLQIGNEYPNAELYGIELNPQIASIASHYCNIVQGNIEDGQNPFQKQYDCIMLGDVLEHLHDAEETLLRLKGWLKQNGCFIISLPNIMHISVIQELLHGRFEYKNEGILDRTHLHFFTLAEITILMHKCGLSIDEISGITVPISQDAQAYMKSLCQFDSAIPKTQLEVYQYRIRAGILSE